MTDHDDTFIPDLPPEPGEVDDCNLGVPGDPEPLPDGDADGDGEPDEETDDDVLDQQASMEPADDEEPSNG